MANTRATSAVLAMPTAPAQRKREILTTCQELGLSLKTLPSLAEFAQGKATVSQLRDVAIEDLLRRDPVVLDAPQIAAVLSDRTVLVTGAAGSIGSELVRQIAEFSPRRLLLVDHNENGLFFLEREFRRSHPRLDIACILADIRDSVRINAIFGDHRPEVVFHAAAHKHVPLMEANPTEAIRNNIFGTQVVADAAAASGVDRFVLISTDKAVNPTSVMGTSKRIAEMYVQSLARERGLRFVAVRFGNVLGSAGSVVPIFRQAIERGEPVRVTHPEMRRYFMTIPEASQLVMQAGALASGGEIFVLDMGEPVRIVDLARDMIVLSGLKPDIDITIEFTGTRPGEKLYEELMLDGDAAGTTPHPKILVAKPRAVSRDEITSALGRLERLIRQVSEPTTIWAELSAIVPEATLGQPPPRTEIPGPAPVAIPSLAR